MAPFISLGFLQQYGELGIVSVGYAAAGFGITMLGSALPFITEKYSVNDHILGIFFLVYYLGLCVGNVLVFFLLLIKDWNRRMKVSKEAIVNPKGVWTNLSDLDIGRKLFLIGLLLSAITLFLIFIALQLGTGYNLFVVLNVSFGICISLVDLATNCIIADLDASTAAFGLNLLHFGFGSGAVVTPYIFKLAGFEWTYLIFGIFSFLCFASAMGIILNVQRMNAAAKPPATELPASQEVQNEAPSVVPLDNTETETPQPNVNAATTAPATPPMTQELRLLSLDPLFWIVVIATLFYVGCELVIAGCS
eukprot:TRINITY_DN8932_c0_g1_i2.p1 TRINITY_DN8932_c0_g1~~TRINITY_DN8932_c0_g1_i2.p1  ORF type:complete len:307 (+),score=20.09 TRINITY_DN8932_c0_g1_i2:112-1032(+)